MAGPDASAWLPEYSSRSAAGGPVLGPPPGAGGTALKAGRAGPKMVAITQFGAQLTSSPSYECKFSGLALLHEMLRMGFYFCFENGSKAEHF
jgi:hypothetical protein